jgi:lipase chaperone LimK
VRRGGARRRARRGARVPAPRARARGRGGRRRVGPRDARGRAPPRHPAAATGPAPRVAELPRRHRGRRGARRRRRGRPHPVRRFFDYFLTSVGEEPLATVRARIDSALIARLPPRAAAQATALLARYLDYREAARGLRLDDDLDARIAAVRALRRDRLGADAATKLFAEADAADDAALRRRRVLAETEPGGAERARGLAEVDAQLPDRLRAAARATTAPLAALRHEEELRARGAGEEEVTAARAAAFGPDGAARLEALDRQRAAFRARVDAFRAERARLGPDDARRLLEQMFTPAERVRVDALDRLGR